MPGTDSLVTLLGECRIDADSKKQPAPPTPGRSEVKRVRRWAGTLLAPTNSYSEKRRFHSLNRPQMLRNPYGFFRISLRR